MSQVLWLTKSLHIFIKRSNKVLCTHFTVHGKGTVEIERGTMYSYKGSMEKFRRDKSRKFEGIERNKQERQRWKNRQKIVPEKNKEDKEKEESRKQTEEGQ